MNEYQYEKSLENQYEEAQQAFGKLAINVSLHDLEQAKIDFKKLQDEAKQNGYQLEKACNLNKYWQKQWNLYPQAVFFKDGRDL